MEEEKTRFINPTTDFGFKILYGRPECADELRELLEHVIPEKKITELTFLPTESLASGEDRKKIVCDVKCRDQNGDWFIVEMQKVPYAAFGDRLMIYASHTAVKLLGKGEDYDRTCRLYVVSVLDYVLSLPEDREDCRNSCVREAMIKMMDSGSILSDKIKYIFLQLPRGGRESLEWTERWSWHMRQIATAVSMPETAGMDDHFRRLYERAERSRIEGELLKMYDNMIRDERQIKAEKEWAVNEALARGMAEGLAEGLAEGEARGEARGEAKSRLEVARNLKALGVDVAVIIKSTGLSEEQIREL